MSEVHRPVLPPVPKRGKRGMARAIELVEWSRRCSVALKRAAVLNQHDIAAEVYASQIITLEGVLDMLRMEIR